MIQWIVPVTPSLVFHDGIECEHFDSTSGWMYQEARWVGARCHYSFEIRSLRDPCRADADVTVVSCEETLAQIIALPPTGKVLFRCIAAPPPSGMSVPAWDRVEKHLPRIHSICAIGPDEATAVEMWARSRGFTGTVRWARIGSSVPSTLRGPGGATRRGVAWLGRHVPEKRVRFVVEACALAKVPLTLALVMVSPETNLAELGEAAKEVPEFKLCTLGPKERLQLLQRVRVVATASHADSQWLPGSEIRACGGVAIAERGSLVETSNGAGMMYHDGTVSDLAQAIRFLHDDDVAFSREALRQHMAFIAGGYSSAASSKELFEWVNS